MRLAAVLAITLGLAPPSAAQAGDPLPTEYTLRITPGAHVDLDTGLVLPRSIVPPHHADVLFDRYGPGLFLEFVHGSLAAEPDENVAPPRDMFSERRHQIGRAAGRKTWFATTENGMVARVTSELIDAYGMGGVVLRWVLVPSKAAEFWPGPDNLQATWRGDTLRVTWNASETRYRVVVRIDEQERTSTIADSFLEVPSVPTGAHCVIEVRGLRAGGVVTLPSQLTRHGRDRAAVRGTVVYPDRWYDDSGGLSLARGAIANEGADVVFYLYGVHVPGGGVQHLGRGADTFADLTKVPETGYLPSYGRLDAYDVLAVRTAGGRFAKLMLVPTDNRDLRRGLALHYANLPDGRTQFQQRPGRVMATPQAGGVQVTWSGVENAARYRLTIVDQPTLETTATTLLVSKLPANRVLDAMLVAVDARGEASEPRAILLSTFDTNHRLGEFTLERHERAGFQFATGNVVSDAPAAGAPGPDLLVTGSWGSGEQIQIRAPHGCAPAGELGFGEFPGRIDAVAFLEVLMLHTGSTFLVRTKDGAIASVQCVQTGGSGSDFRYVLRLRD